MKAIFFLLFFLPLFAAGQCDTVTSVTATGIDHDGATISFTTPNAHLYYVILYNGLRQNVNDPGGPYPAMVTAPLTGLTPSTEYTYSIVAYCSPTDSAEGSDFWFTTTDAPCDTVTAVVATPTSGGVTITTTGATYGTSYILYYIRAGETDTLTLADADGDFTISSGLRPASLHYYQIATVCSGTGDTTRNSVRAFTTLAAVNYTAMTGFGYQEKRAAFDSTLSIPTGSAASLRNGKNDKGALFFDTVENVLKIFDPLTQTWGAVASSGGGVIDTIYIHELIVDSIIIYRTLRLPFGDTSTALKRQGYAIYDTILDHFYGYAGSAWACFDCASGAGTVTSVAIASTDLSVSGSPITTSGTITLDVNANGISDAKFRQSGALTVVGRSANSTGNVGDINASTDHYVLRRSGTSLGFGTLNAAAMNPSYTAWKNLSTDASGNLSWVSVDTAGIIDVAGYILSGTFGTDTTAAINAAINDAAGTAKKTIKFSTAASPYVVMTHHRIGETTTNKMGIQLVSNLNVIIDPGVTIYADTAWTATTVNAKFYPVFNGYGVSNVTITGSTGSTIDGQKLTFGNYTANPYTNPSGYVADTANRWSTSGIQFFYGTNNKVYNVYVKDCQLHGYMGMYTTNMFVSNSIFYRNGGSGTDLLRGSTGTFEYNVCDSNASDQMRADFCTLGVINFNYCTGSNAQANASATSWFAGLYINNSSNVHADKCFLHNNSAYGYDNGSDTSYKNNIITNSTMAYNGNAGIVIANAATIKNNWFINNGKTAAGATDTKSTSGYNPAAIAINSVGGLIIEGNHAIDTVSGGNWAQIWFIKQTTNASFGFYRSIITDNFIKGVADTAHIRNGNLGQNAFLNNQQFTNANVPFLDAAAATVWTLNSDGSGRWAAATGGSPAISTLTAAAAGNTIDNTNYEQQWQWSTLASGNGLNLTSTSTAAASNTQTLLNVALSGANGTSTQTTYGMKVSNTHTGTSSTNVGALFTATGGTTDNLAISTVGPASVAGGSLISTKSALSVTGTLNTANAAQTGATVQITSAGSAGQVQTALKASLLSGWTGASSSFGLYAQNQVAGTATDEFSFIQSANYGEYVATTTGTIVGQAGYAAGGNKSYGGMFRSIVAKNSATNIGIAGYALNTGSTPIQVGGYFGLISSAPTFTSAALIANNGTQTSPIFLAQDNGTTVMQIIDGGKVGVGITPTAIMHLKAGTATAETAPLKFTSGTNLTTAEAGAMEYNGTNLFFSPSTVRHTVFVGLAGSAALDFGSTAAQSSADLTITVTGAADGDAVSIGVPNGSVLANSNFTAWVSAADTVTVRFNNYSSGSQDPASGTFKVFVKKN